jgi:hypothetical protein
MHAMFHAGHSQQQSYPKHPPLTTAFSSVDSPSWVQWAQPRRPPHIGPSHMHHSSEWPLPHAHHASDPATQGSLPPSPPPPSPVPLPSQPRPNTPYPTHPTPNNSPQTPTQDSRTVQLDSPSWVQWAHLPLPPHICPSQKHHSCWWGWHQQRAHRGADPAMPDSLASPCLSWPSLLPPSLRERARSSQTAAAAAGVQMVRTGAACLGLCLCACCHHRRPF